MFFILVDSRTLWTQIPDKFENLQVLPKDIPKRELVEMMKGFTSGLGQSCEYCHVGEGRDLSTFNFASDEKAPKKTARAMIQMVHAINEQYLGKIQTSSKMRINVTCSTCHHGQARPEPIEDVIRAKLNEDGIESAIQKYRDLRKQYYGDYVFDFTESPLNRLSTELAQKEKLSDSIALLKLNAEYHNQSAWVEFLLGEVFLKNGMTDEALLHYKKSLELDSANDFVKKKIEELTASKSQ
jgi:tetratricopeptide (TPR) repeat protein